MNIYEKIADIAYEKQISINSLERDCGFARSTIRKWKEHSPTLASIEKVAEVLKVSVSEFIEKEG